MQASTASRKIGLGTVQFGSEYGIANRLGRASRAEIQGILEDAAGAGVRVLDTAPGYGNSEALLGELKPENAAFDFVTKTPVGQLAESPADAARSVTEGMLESLRRLRIDSVYGLLEHRPERLLGEQGDAIFEAMLGLRDAGLSRRIGVSAYTPAQLDAICARYPLDLVQIPLSVFDQRLLVGGRLRALKEKGVEVHARSVLLQGVVGMTPRDLPDYLAAMRSPLAKLRQLAEGLGISPVAAAIDFVERLAEVDVVLCGVEGRSQLREILTPGRPQIETIGSGGFRELAICDPQLIDPSCWPEVRK